LPALADCFFPPWIPAAGRRGALLSRDANTSAAHRLSKSEAVKRYLKNRFFHKPDWFDMESFSFRS